MEKNDRQDEDLPEEEDSLENLINEARAALGSKPLPSAELSGDTMHIPIDSEPPQQAKWTQEGRPALDSHYLNRQEAEEEPMGHTRRIPREKVLMPNGPAAAIPEDAPASVRDQDDMLQQAAQSETMYPEAASASMDNEDDDGEDPYNSGTVIVDAEEVVVRNGSQSPGTVLIPDEQKTPEDAVRKAWGMPKAISGESGKYEIISQLGRGGMGVVFKARQSGLNREVALKMMLEGAHSTPVAKKRFLREAQAVAKLRHQNIVTVHDYGTFNNQPFFVMDYVDGTPLDRLCFRKGWSGVIAAELMIKIADAIHFAHEHGIIHRDLKPENILIDRKGQPVITDFGLAKDLSNRDQSMLSISGDIMGTPGYMSPEQARGEHSRIDRRADVFSLGALLYAMTAGKEPFRGRTIYETLDKVINVDPEPIVQHNPDIDRSLAVICYKAMEKDRKHRYQSAREMADDLERFCDGKPVLALPAFGARQITRYVQKNWIPFTFVPIGMIAVLIAAIFTYNIFTRDYFDIAAAQLKSDNAAIRAQVVTTLGNEIVKPDQLGREDVVPAAQLLLTMNNDPDPEVKKALWQFLAKYGDCEAISQHFSEDFAAELLKTANDNSDPSWRNLAIDMIGMIRRSDFAAYLIQRLHEKNDALRIRIVRALGNQRTKKAIKPLMLLSIRDPIARPEAEAALDKIYTKRRFTLFGTHDAKLKTAMRDMQRGMANYNEKLEALMNDTYDQPEKEKRNKFAEVEKALRSADVNERLRAVYELAHVADPESANLLLDALDDEENIAMAAATVLGKLKAPGLCEKLKAKLMGGSSKERGHAATALAMQRDEDAVDHMLVSLTQERDEAIMVKIIEALGEAGFDKAKPTLTATARSRPKYKELIDHALERIEEQQEKK